MMIGLISGEKNQSQSFRTMKLRLIGELLACESSSRLPLIMQENFNARDVTKMYDYIFTSLILAFYSEI